MKKLLFCLFTLTASTLLFAEPKFLGVSFNLTKDEAVKKDIEDSLEKKLETAFIEYCKDVDLDFSYNKSDKKLNTIRVDFENVSKPSFKAYLYAYFMDNLKCKYINNTFYNDEIIAYMLDTFDGSGGQFSVFVSSRKPFNDLFDSLN